MSRLAAGFILMVLTAELLWPTEDAASGRGLYLVILWMAAALLVLVRRWLQPDVSDVASDGEDAARQPSSDAQSQTTARRALAGRMGRLADLCVCLIAAGHWLSTWLVFHRSGDRRSALNLCFEWLGLLVAWFLFRQLLRSREFAGSAFRVVIALTVGLAAYGIWQHHFFYAEQAAWYQEQRGWIDQAVTSDDPVVLRKAQAARREFEELQIPLQGVDQFLWEQRLLASSEPMGPYALANTFAGVLSWSLVTLVGSLLASLSKSRRSTALPLMLQRAVLFTLFAVLLYCLMLTKSKSAWIATAVMTVLMIAGWRSSEFLRRQLRWLVPVGGALTAAAFIGGAFLGALDKEIILESPRSMQYRLMYWQGTGSLLRDSPLLGTGPANFRQQYLRYKVPESSEEVRDPHNLFLDIWTSGGLLSLAGLLGILAVTLMSGRRSSVDPESDGNRLRSSTDPVLTYSASRWGWLLNPLLAGCLLHWCWDWLDLQMTGAASLAWLLIPGVGLIALCCLRWIPLCFDAAVGRAGVLGLAIHLLVAGGIEMPAVVLLMWLSAAAAVTLMTVDDGRLNPAAKQVLAEHEGRLASSQQKWIVAGMVACLVSIGVIVFFGMQPVHAAASRLAEARWQLSQSRRSAAEREFQLAIEVDPLSTDAPAQFARYEIGELVNLIHGFQLRAPTMARGATDVHEIVASPRSLTVLQQEQLQKARQRMLDACEQMIQADQTTHGGYSMAAQGLWLLYSTTEQPSDLLSAMEYQRRVLDRYPNNSEHHALLAKMVAAAQDRRLETGGLTAREAAEHALQLDAINHDWGHRDRYLSETVVAELEELLPVSESN
ncbi:MAG: O-antigen ligase family protein [Planctomycetaceae bacterium]|nr:O-antigen ligase family protein [Planctomycetaceae bacterium]